MTIERHTIPPGMRLHPLRAHDLTASDIAAAIGESPFKTALALYAEKTGHLMPEPETPIMLRGLDLEHAAIAKLRRERPDWQVEYPLNLYIRDSELRLGATPDAIRVNGDGSETNLQIKAINRHTFEKEWANGAPLHYVLQTATEGMLLDAEASILVVLVVDYASLELLYFDVPRHPEAEQRLKAHAKNFWDNVASGRRPEADYKRDAETLAALFPISVKEPILDLSAENELPERLRERATLKVEIAIREARVKEIEVLVKDKLGPAEIAELPGWRISWRTQTRKEHVVPEITFRSLLIREVKLDEEEKAA